MSIFWVGQLDRVNMYAVTCLYHAEDELSITIACPKVLVMYLYMVIDAGSNAVSSCGDCANAGDPVGAVHYGVRGTLLQRF